MGPLKGVIVGCVSDKRYGAHLALNTQTRALSLSLPELFHRSSRRPLLAALHLIGPLMLSQNT